MRRKNKKKCSTQNAKQEQHARFNTYKRRIMYYLKLLGCEEVVRLIDDVSFQFMYQRRNFSIPRLCMANDTFADRETKDDMHAMFEQMYSDKTIKINDRLTVSPKEVMLYLNMIDCVVNSKKDSSVSREILLIEKYSEKIGDFGALFEQAFEAITVIINSIGIVMTHMNSSLCWLKYVAREKGSFDQRNIIEVNEYIPKKRLVMINNHPRPVYPLCLALANVGPVEISIPTEKVNLPGSIDRKSIPVYVQNHLLHRLEERLDCIPPYISQLHLFISIQTAELIYYRGKIYAEYLMDSSIKLGYILLECCDDMLVAKTFLLLSNTGTPEGDKLNEISGMKKFDHKYWAIDKLSTFHNSDLKDHPQTRDIFEKAGCGSLFEPLSYPNDVSPKSVSIQAQEMIHYLQGTSEEVNELHSVAV